MLSARWEYARATSKLHRLFPSILLALTLPVLVDGIPRCNGLNCGEATDVQIFLLSDFWHRVGCLCLQAIVTRSMRVTSGIETHQGRSKVPGRRHRLEEKQDICNSASTN